ncbi:MAG: phosphatase PAP2 family protein [Chloroflexi bacterium]|nr:phosphatase PAP2 family protein [Chloroflexota bacterium]
METILDIGITVVLFFQGLGNWLTTPMEIVTFLGSEEFYLLFLPAIYWSIDAALGIRVGVILLLTTSLNALLKWSFHLPRPYWYDSRVLGMHAETGFGVPSGHSQTPAAILGLIAVSVKRRWASILLITLIGLIGISRLYLGVHFPHDVLLGWFFGWLSLWLFLRYENNIKTWLSKQGLGKQVAAILFTSLAIILVGGLILGTLNGFEIPSEWIENALADQPDGLPDPLNLKSVITPSATLFGLGVGALWLNTRGGYSAKGNWWQRLLRYLVGIVGVLLIWAGLDAVFPEGPSLMAYSLRFLRYALVGIWVSMAGPLLFFKIGLAQPSKN